MSIVQVVWHNEEIIWQQLSRHVSCELCKRNDICLFACVIPHIIEVRKWIVMLDVGILISANVSCRRKGFRIYLPGFADGRQRCCYVIAGKGSHKRIISVNDLPS